MMNKETAPKDGIPPRIYATFIIRGKDLDPQVVTELLGIAPTRSFKRGDQRTENKKWPHGFWGLTSDERVHSIDLALHIEWVINQLEPVKRDLLEIISESGIDAEISCFWIMPTNHEYLQFGSELLRRLADLSLPLNVDIYSDD